MKILALDTATENCSVALWIDGRIEDVARETPREHASLVLGMIDQLLAGAGLALTQLDAIAFGRGPGSFTGVRLAAAVTQGLAFAADLPVLPISNLRALAAQGFESVATADFAHCCADARMGEVYHAVYGRDGQLHGIEQVLPPAAVAWDLPVDARVVAVGQGFAAYSRLADLAPRGWLASLAQALPRARDIVALASGDLQSGRAVAATDALPVYLRNNVVTRP